MTVALVSEDERIRARLGLGGTAPGGGAVGSDVDGPRVRVVSVDSAEFSGASAHEPLFVTDAAGAGLDRLRDLVGLTRRITPSRAEFAMHAAYGAALRSAALRGGVGAALVDGSGDVVALGAVEVPRWGGQYWDGDEDDARDVVFGVDAASRARTVTVERLLELLAGMGTTLPAPPERLVGGLLEAFDSSQGSYGVGHGGAPAQSFESLGRVVHAEMAALVCAARSGVPVAGLTMFVTAQPCRQCLRHLVCAGLARVVHLGPAQEAAPWFHADSVTVREDEAGRMPLTPFTGVGPGAYELLFGRQMRHTFTTPGET
ncbi:MULTISPECIES: deaminase [Actinosynnema]|uniref:deaminase n=1 Tax=Actinosynnema TaxID=40566 RepID=UPI0020A383CD|nr:deaminase [Actinosynnema pretiosum]MCP2097744.1 Cytidine and deoxycytidylate deaminase zinc-binding region [Actinosynnema pretiosum]